jgi:polysaccharide chain length determinant protein (PEP-CTERM system associated)
MKNLAQLSPADYLKIIFRRKWYVLTAFLIVGIGVGIYAWRKPVLYRSASMIQVETAIVPQEYVRSSVRTTPEELIKSIRGTIQSRSFLERMIQDFQLFGYGLEQGFSMEDAIKAVGNSIEITTSSTNTFNVAFFANNPQLAQSLTRRMVETLIQSSESVRKSKAIGADQFLEEQLRQTSEKLLAQEEKIKQFKMRNLGGLPEQANANISALGRLDVQLATVKTTLQQLRDRQKAQEIMDQSRKQMLLQYKDMDATNLNLPQEEIQDSGKSALLTAKEAELEALKARYTSQHPDVVKVANEVERIKLQIAKEKEEATKLIESNPSNSNKDFPQPENPDSLLAAMPDTANLDMASLKEDVKQREREQDSILSQIRTIQGRLNLAPALEQELSVLSREYGNLKQQYESLQGKKFQSQMTTNLEANKNSETYKIIDDASLPENPIPPTRLQIIGFGLIVSFAAGVGAAFGRELLDTTLGSEEEVAALLKIPVLTTISEVPEKQLKKRSQSSSMRKSA